MKILFLTHYYPPEVNAPANRVHEHAREWVGAGHEVTVVTGVPNHPHGKLFPGYANRFQEDVIDGIRIIRTPMVLAANAGFAKRILNFVAFAVTAFVAGLRAERPDVVVATSPQFFCGVAGALVALVRRRPFVLEVRDLWPDSIVQLGQLNNRTIIRAIEAVETWLYRRATRVVVLTKAFARHIAARGVPEERIALVYNGIDADAWQPRQRDEALLAKHGLTERFTVAYVGTLGLAHGLVQVLDAAERLREEMPDLHLVFIGEGADRERIQIEAKERGLDHVHFTGLLPRDEVPGWISSLDVLLVMLRDLPVFETVIPSKIFEYLALERPVILAAPREGEIRKMVEGANVGLSIDAENPEQLAGAIREVRHNPAAAHERAKRGHEWVFREFRRADLARRMLNTLAEAAEGAR